MLVRRRRWWSTSDNSLREAADQMVAEDIGRLPVVGVEAPHALVGILTRSDLLAAHGQRLKETHQAGRHIDVRAMWRRPPEANARLGDARTVRLVPSDPSVSVAPRSARLRPVAQEG